MTFPTFEPHPALSASSSLLWVLFCGGLMTGCFVVAWRNLLHYRSREVRANTASRTPAPPELLPGPILLGGHVETDGAEPAVRFEIDQIGREVQNKSSYTHTWTEIDRTVQVRPFRLRLPNQEVVTVVPDERVRLVDNLETESFNENRRRRVAELSAKEKVWVSGTLSREGQKSGPSTAYRQGPSSWVMRGTRLDPLELSSGSLSRQFTYWQSFYRKAAIILTIGWLLVHGLLFGPYYLLAISGKVTTASIIKTSTYVTSSKNGKTTHYVIHARLPDKDGGHLVDDEVGYNLYESAKSGFVKEAPFLYSKWFPRLHQIGQRPMISVVLSIISLLLSLGPAIWFFFAIRSARPWYEQRKVVESGDGRLLTSVWKVQVAGAKGLFVDGAPK